MKYLILILTAVLMASGYLQFYHPDFGRRAHFVDNSVELKNLIRTGKLLYTEYQCVGCHGKRGDTPVQSYYPKVRAQSEEYLLQQLMDFKYGHRDNGQSSVMRDILYEVSDEDLKKTGCLFKS